MFMLKIYKKKNDQKQFFLLFLTQIKQNIILFFYILRNVL